MAVVQAQKKIVDLGNAPYLRAREIAAELGMKLASHVLHDDYLVRSNRHYEVRRIYAAWARELLVHPEKDGQFVKGKDIVDSHNDNAGRELIVPWSEIARFGLAEAVIGPKIGLFLDPEHIDTSDNKRAVIHAASIVLLKSFIQNSGNEGKVDEATRVPLEVAPELWERLSYSEKRVLYRIDGVGVRPLVRTVDGCDLNYYILADSRYDNDYGVAGEAIVNIATEGHMAEAGASVEN